MLLYFSQLLIACLSRLSLVLQHCEAGDALPTLKSNWKKNPSVSIRFSNTTEDWFQAQWSIGSYSDVHDKDLYIWKIINEIYNNKKLIKDLLRGKVYCLIIFFLQQNWKGSLKNINKKYKN